MDYAEEQRNVQKNDEKCKTKKEKENAKEQWKINKV